MREGDGRGCEARRTILSRRDSIKAGLGVVMGSDGSRNPVYCVGKGLGLGGWRERARTGAMGLVGGCRLRHAMLLVEGKVRDVCSRQNGRQSFQGLGSRGIRRGFVGQVLLVPGLRPIAKSSGLSRKCVKLEPHLKVRVAGWLALLKLPDAARSGGKPNHVLRAAHNLEDFEGPRFPHQAPPCFFFRDFLVG